MCIRDRICTHALAEAAVQEDAENIMLSGPGLGAYYRDLPQHDPRFDKKEVNDFDRQCRRQIAIAQVHEMAQACKRHSQLSWHLCLPSASSCNLEASRIAIDFVSEYLEEGEWPVDRIILYEDADVFSTAQHLQRSALQALDRP